MMINKVRKHITSDYDYRIITQRSSKGVILKGKVSFLSGDALELMPLYDTTRGPVTYERLTQGMPSNLPLAFGKGEEGYLEIGE